MTSEIHLSAISARTVRSGFFARHPSGCALVAACLGTTFPGIGAEIHRLLPVLVPLFVGFAVLATELGPPARTEIVLVLVMLVITTVISPAAVTVMTMFVQLPWDFRLATLLLAATPVALSAGALSYSVGRPARPAVWAAVLGLLMAPLCFSMVMVAVGYDGHVAPSRLALRFTIVGLLPVVGAVLIRQKAPRTVAVILPRLRDGVVLTLLPLMFAAGSSIHIAFVSVPSDGAAAVVLAIGTLVLCAGISVVAGQCLGCSSSLLSLAIIGGARNGTVAWAVASSILSERAELVLSTASVAALAMPWLLKLPLFLASLWPGKRSARFCRSSRSEI